MRRHMILTAALLLLWGVSLFAAGETGTPAPESGTGLFQLLVVVGYLLGIFILLPIVYYTNQKEKLFTPNPENPEEIQPIESTSEEERNNRARLILEGIESQLTPSQPGNSEGGVTITKGKQARFMKRGLDYINTKLVPTDTGVIERTNEFAAVYEGRTQRVFTGSKLIIGCGAVTGVVYVFFSGITNFVFFHLVGLGFYALASKTTAYALEKRMKNFRSGTGIIKSIMAAILIGESDEESRRLVKDIYGNWVRKDHETEGMAAMLKLVCVLMVAVIVGFLVAFFGVVNFFLNYSTSYWLPFKSDDDWYANNFTQVTA